MLQFKIYKGDCLCILQNIPDSSVDMILCDLPFGTTFSYWDKQVNITELWKIYERIIKNNGAILLHASQPFTSLVVSSNVEMFKYEWIWNKENAANFANAKINPLKQHESVLVFSKGVAPYYPIKVQGKKNNIQGVTAKESNREGFRIKYRADDDRTGMKYPKSILNFPRHSSQCRNHPNEKPVSLLRYLIRTHSVEGDIVLDNCMGSGSTGVACLLEDRKFIGIEKESKYFEIAEKRLQDTSDWAHLV